VLLKKLGWWDELTDAEKKKAEGKNWKTDPSGGIIRVAMKNHGCHPFGNAKARAVVWNFPDPVPAAPRAALQRHRPDLVAKYPTHDDKKAFWRLPTLYKSVQEKNKDIGKTFPLIMTSGRLVEYEGGGEETRSNPWLAELQQDMFVEINPKAANDRGIRNGDVRVGEDARPGRARVQGQGAGDRAGGARTRCGCPSTSPAAGRARTCCPTTRGRGAGGARRGRQHRHDLRLRQRHDDAGNQDDGLPDREVRPEGAPAWLE
jgi:hypothetical protein